MTAMLAKSLAGRGAADRRHPQPAGAGRHRVHRGAPPAPLREAHTAARRPARVVDPPAAGARRHAPRDAGSSPVCWTCSRGRRRTNAQRGAAPPGGKRPGPRRARLRGPLVHVRRPAVTRRRLGRGVGRRRGHPRRAPGAHVGEPAGVRVRGLRRPAAGRRGRDVQPGVEGHGGTARLRGGRPAVRARRRGRVRRAGGPRSRRHRSSASIDAAPAAAGDPGPFVDDVDADAVLVFSSGTTGLPKAVRHTHRSLGHGGGALDRVARAHRPRPLPGRDTSGAHPRSAQHRHRGRGRMHGSASTRASISTRRCARSPRSA